MGTDNSGNTLSLSEAVYQKVADREGVPAETLNPPLYDVIEPDALDTIFRGDTGHISFEYHGNVVTVDHAGNVSVEPEESE